MSRFHDYDPNEMFPRKRKRKRTLDDKVIRWLIIATIALFVILIGTGCKNIRSIDAGFGGLEVEYWPSHPSQEDKSIFDFSAVTNRVNTVPAGWNGPVLMQRR